MNNAESDGLSQFVTGEWNGTTHSKDTLQLLLIARNKIDELIKGQL